MLAPKIHPIKEKCWECKQSKFSQVPKCPLRMLAIGPSGSGKSVALQNMILDIYRNCFSRIYIFSPSIEIDSIWDPVKEYIKKELKPSKDEKYLFDHYDPKDLEKIIDQQYKITEYLKKQKKKKLYQILLIIDDFADSPEFTRNSPLLHQLYIRGRHSMISTITATQWYKVINPIVRKNVTDLIIFKLRNYADLEGIVEELAALTDKKILHNIYQQAVEQPFAFLYVNLTAKNINDMFWINFEKKIIVDDYGEGGDQDNKLMDGYDDIDPIKGKGKGMGYDINYDPKGKGGGKGSGKGYM